MSTIAVRSNIEQRAGPAPGRKDQLERTAHLVREETRDVVSPGAGDDDCCLASCGEGAARSRSDSRVAGGDRSFTSCEPRRG